MKLRDISFEIENLVTEYNADEWQGQPVTDERRGEIENELNALDLTIEEKAANYADLIAHYESDAETIKAEEKRLAIMRKRVENSVEWLRRNLESQLLILGKRKIETDFWKFSFRRSESLIVRAEDALPDRFLIPVPAAVKPDNAKIKKAMQAKFIGSKEWYGEFECEDIPGAVLLVKQGLQIK